MNHASYICLGSRQLSSQIIVRVQQVSPPRVAVIGADLQIYISRRMHSSALANWRNSNSFLSFFSFGL